MDALNPSQSSDTLAAGLADGYRAVAQQRYRFLVHLREFDLHRAYKGRGKGPHGAADTPDWLQFTCGMPREQAQEQLQVAYALLNLPRIEAAFEAGELSYAKVRALASVATLTDEATMLPLARVMSDAQVQDHCRRRGPRQSKRCRDTRRRAAPAPIYSAPVSVAE